MLAWLVIVPRDLELDECYLLFYGPSGPSDPDRLWPMCWTDLSYVLVDANAGGVVGSGEAPVTGPEMTRSELSALKRFAWAEGTLTLHEDDASVRRFQPAKGWWELWHRIREYNGKQLPDGLAAELDRPDAVPPPPTPTATPGPDAPPTPTPTPVPLVTQAPLATATSAPAATPTSTPTPPEVVHLGSRVASGMAGDGQWELYALEDGGEVCLTFHTDGRKSYSGCVGAPGPLRPMAGHFHDDGVVMFGLVSMDVAAVRFDMPGHASLDVPVIDAGLEATNLYVLETTPPDGVLAGDLVALNASGEEVASYSTPLHTPAPTPPTQG